MEHLMWNIDFQYAGWSAGQLEDESARNGWLNVSTSLENISEVIFDTPFSERYQKVMSIIGIDPSHLSGEVGHA